ncbi:MAG: FAD-binding oxidoreductase [Theionarchaea archaeon]|nr:FAD-binding oxidoreductase [Theionarchaea archaeon]
MSEHDEKTSAYSNESDVFYHGIALSEEKRSAIRKSLEKIISKRNVSDTYLDRISYSKDYWPIALRWMLEGKIAALPDIITWPSTAEQISCILSLANDQHIPVIPFGEGSGVLGGVVPVYGGIIVDMKKMDSILAINDTNLTVTVQSGINGMNLERTLNHEGYTMGHIPQSLYCSSLGGWLACRAAGQFSTKYGKIDDMIISLEAVLPQGEIIRSKSVPNSSTGPQIDRLLLGAEGILGIVTEATLKIWPYPEERILRSYSFHSVHDGLESIRLILRKGIFPAVVRLYDEIETSRHFYDIPEAQDKCMLILVMEGSKVLVEIEERVSQEVCTDHGGVACGTAPVQHWFETRFNVRETSDFSPRDVIFDTIEVSVMWDKALGLYEAMTSAMKAIEGVMFASAHASHVYTQGVCFYFTFGGVSGKRDPLEFYRTVWSAAMRSCLDAGGSISHHHGIGIMRAPWLAEELGTSYTILKRLKRMLDPNSIMNPGKMGFTHDTAQ